MWTLTSHVVTSGVPLAFRCTWGPQALLQHQLHDYEVIFSEPL